MTKYRIKALVPDDEGGITTIRMELNSWSLHGAVSDFYKKASLGIGRDITSLIVTREGKKR